MSTEVAEYKDPLPLQQPELSSQDIEFWTEHLGVGPAEIPDIVVGCTGSLRKVLMFLYTVKRFGLIPVGSNQAAQNWQEAMLDLPPYIEQQLAERGVHSEYQKRVRALFELPDDEIPLALQQLLKDLIPNGDGTIPVGSRIKIGTLHRVELFIQSGDGETPDNDYPSLESEAKALAVGRDTDFQNKKVLFIGMDTIGQPQSGKRASKPASEPEYKAYKKKPEVEKRESWEVYYSIWYLLFRYLGLIQEQFEDWLQNFDTVEAARQQALEKIAQNTTQSFSETHIVGIAVILGDKSFKADIKSMVTISALFQELIDMGFDDQAGMAGFFQQLVFRNLDQIDFKSSVNRLLSRYGEYRGQEITELDKKLLLLFHIMGMPIAALSVILNRLNRHQSIPIRNREEET